MKRFKADLHIHSCLSPCGDLDMSPRTIVEKGLERVNSICNAPIVMEYWRRILTVYTVVHSALFMVINKVFSRYRKY